MNAADEARLRTWVLNIAETLIGARGRNEGNQCRFPHQGGLSINRHHGAWYCFSSGACSHKTLRLIEYLGYSREDAVKWAEAWLSSHAGSGKVTGHPDDSDDGAPYSKDDAEDALARAVDITGTPAERYLREQRRIDAPFPPDLKYLPNARCGEGALVAPLYSQGRVVGAQLVHLDPLGRKSVVPPIKLRFNLEKAPDGVFCLPYEGENTDVVVVEGIENALTLWRYGALRRRILGLPGGYVLRNLHFTAGIKILVVADGKDEAGSLAAQALQGGLDKLLLDDLEVVVTDTATGRDVNGTLIEEGVEALQDFIEKAQPAVLSQQGEIDRLARLDELAYERERKAAAKRIDIRPSVLDRLVAKARVAAAAQHDDDWTDVNSTRPWHEEVDGAVLLNDLATVIRAFVVMPAEQAWAIALWVVFTHAFDVALAAPKLWIKSAEKRSGKTRLLEILVHLVNRPLAASYMTPATIFRLIDAGRPTLLLDEADTFLKGDERMRGLLDMGFSKAFAKVYVCIGDNRDPTEFSVWAPQALAGIGELTDTVRDRSTRIELQRKPRSEKVARLREGDAGPLVQLAEKCARWVADHRISLVTAEPEMPVGLHDRAQDAWHLPLAIADIAGAHWPERARRAAQKLSGDGTTDESIGVQLLSDIRDIFEELRRRWRDDKRSPRIASLALVDRLANIEGGLWAEYGQGGRGGAPLTQHQLAQLLRPFHVTPTQWKANQAKTRGYKRAQFKDAWERYLSPLPPTPTQPSGKPNGADFTDAASSSSEQPGDAAQSPPDATSFAQPPEPPSEVGTSAPNEDFRGFQSDLRSVPGGNGTDHETPENPNETAKGAEVTTSTSQNGGCAEWSATTGKPNGEDITKEPPTREGPRTRAVREVLAEHPDWGADKIGKHLGQPAANIATILKAIGP